MRDRSNRSPFRTSAALGLAAALFAGACAAPAPRDRARVSGQVEATAVRVAGEIGGRIVELTVNGKAVSAEVEDRTLLVHLLREHLKLMMPGSKAFGIPPSTDTAKMVRADLAAASIPSKDEAGRVVDFHALRHTFLTLLASSGVHPKVAQDLARHSDINLTLSRYSHTVLEQRSEAVERLPDFEVGEASEAAEVGEK